MTINEFQNALNAAPFGRFIIHLADGRSIPVVHPDFVLVTGKGRTAIISRPEDDWFAIVDLLLISQLEVPADMAPAI
ncbi:MAG TPA: hypothetical protein VLI42_04495 [Chthoniobacterales bacterium]|jgi:hypothetical protein|nr:hypothetical protein [Chthoniobacterales bacterium]